MSDLGTLVKASVMTFDLPFMINLPDGPYEVKIDQFNATVYLARYRSPSDMPGLPQGVMFPPDAYVKGDKYGRFNYSKIRIEFHHEVLIKPGIMFQDLLLLKSIDIINTMLDVCRAVKGDHYIRIIDSDIFSHNLTYLNSVGQQIPGGMFAIGGQMEIGMGGANQPTQQEVSRIKKILSTSSLQLSQFSLSVWFKTSKNYVPDPIKGGEGMMITKGGWISNNKGEQLSYGIWISDANHLRAGFETVDGTDNILTTSGIKVNDGLWHHAAITYDSSKLKLYLDGKLFKEMVTSAQPENNDIPLVIGKNPLERKDGYFKGSLADIKVFNKAISEAEVASHYNNHNGLVYSTG